MSGYLWLLGQSMQCGAQLYYCMCELLMVGALWCMLCNLDAIAETVAARCFLTAYTSQQGPVCST